MNSFLFGRRKAGADPRLHESYAPLSLLKLDAADRAVILVADARDCIQKRTFTRWVNQQLKQKSTRISDLFQDLRNGFALITLLEVLSGHVLPVERGHLRFHYLQNVEIALQFLQFDGARIVNIRPDDIVDGNPKLTLGLVWVIILHYQRVRIQRRMGSFANISEILPSFSTASGSLQRQQQPQQQQQQLDDNRAVRDFLLAWCRAELAPYGLSVTNFTSCWQDGRAFVCLLHRARPDLIDPERTSRLSNAERLRLAFDINERHLGVARLLEPEDVDTPHADDLSLITYLSALYDALADRPIGRSQAGDERDGDAEEEANKREELAYREAASELSAWLQRAAKEAAAAGDPPTGLTQARVNAEAAQALLTEISERTSVQLQDLRQRYDRLSQAASAAVPQHQRRRQQQLEAGAHPDQLGRQAERCLALARDRCRSAQLHRQRLERLHRLAEAARTDIGALEARLADLGDSERHLRASLSSAAASASSSLDAMDAESAMDRLARNVSKAGEAVNRLFERIQRLRDERYGRAEQLYHSLCTAHLAYLELHRLVDSLAPRIRLLQQQHRGQQHRRLERQHYRDVTSVSRAFSDSPAFSPIRRCMGRVRERREQLDRAEAATMAAAAAAAAAQEDIAGLDELRRQVDWQREFCQSANDTVAEAAACGAIGDGLPESDRATYAALLTELEAACTDLTGAAQRRLRHLEAWLAFAESAASLLAWLDERETRVLRLQRRELRLAEVADVEAYLKGCLQRLQSTVSELEDREAKFAAAVTSGARLIRRYAAAGGRSTSGSPAAAHRPRPACAAWRSAGPPTSAWPAACSTRPKPPRPLPPTPRGEARPGQPGRHHPPTWHRISRPAARPVGRIHSQPAESGGRPAGAAGPGGWRGQLARSLRASSSPACASSF
ncbi:hypothetical protein BOX15_Mlig001914g1 [Macrostomum lignano]|uniref:Calponin-homology (CH) domain-containing protein n=1 Tax=Macrostomum lignano TaxID=282301 RepID=A0A267DG62_9PLAT|nr:hypothetical protein BOX15_Mlig001914g1 [Macrostomum lignano]